MNQQEDRLSFLLQQYADNNLTFQQQEELSGLLLQHWNQTNNDQQDKEVDWEKMVLDILGTGIKGPAHRVHFMKTTWFRYAAAALIVCSIGAYLWNTQTSKNAALQPSISSKVKKDVPAPSANRAVLTLANGQQIFLDSSVNGILASQSNVNIVKTGDDLIVYKITGDGAKMQYNTLTVPGGSQIAGLVLADGTKVFLNAASSLKYPVSFADNERRVEITGEAYFEVAKDPSRKFIVNSGGLTTEVLGTHFNVNTYDDEESKKITLIEGSVKVNNHASALLISPGEQVEVKKGKMHVNRSVDIDQVMAWKNGFFNFQDKRLPEVMRQLARWYNIEVFYESDIPEIEFFGQMGRNLKLSDVLEVLASADVHFRIEEGNRLIVIP